MATNLSCKRESCSDICPCGTKGQVDNTELKLLHVYLREEAYLTLRCSMIKRVRTQTALLVPARTSVIVAARPRVAVARTTLVIAD
jgi:hypothetical protein